MIKMLMDKELKNEDLELISYLQLKDIEKSDKQIKEKINMVRSSLRFNCIEAFHILGEILRDNFNTFHHHEIMNILKDLDSSQRIGCIEPLLDILDDFENMEPKSRYLYQQMEKVIKIVGKSRKKWLIPILTPYTQTSSKLLKNASKEAIKLIND